MGSHRVALVVATLMGAGAMACTPAEEIAILIEAAPQELVTVDEPVATNLAVARLGQEVDARRSQRVALRQDVGPDAPFRVAVGLATAGNYAVHIDVIRGEAVWSSTLCLSVTKVVRLNVPLLRGGAPTDADEDGWTALGPGDCGSYAGGLADCDDADPLTHPFAYDVCGNTLDEDCVGDDGECTDQDGDGVGDERDCDDTDADVHPGATEDCDPERDLDCDGEPRCDEDGDRFLAGDDCDDADPAVNPAAPERCDDAVDSDCSGDPSNGCVDDDQDGDDHVAREAGGDDCSDCDPGVYPGAPDPCGDGIDQDCDGADEPCSPDDGDHDGVVDVAAGGTDCNDADPRIYPGAPEACGSAEDRDCDGSPGGCDREDADGDQWEVGDDCNDGDDAVNPGATEVCNDVDDDCDGVVDEPTNCVALTDSTQNCGGCWIRCIGQCDVDECRCGDGPDCEAGESCCEGGCVDVTTDTDNCGGCGLACRPNEDCEAGVCSCGNGPACQANEECCGNDCVDLDDDNDNCGRCGLDCGRYVRCEAGLCRCPGEEDRGVDLLTDPDHCGNCQTRCGNCDDCIDGDCHEDNCSDD